MIDRVSEMYWSSRNAKTFVDNMKAYYKGNVQAGRVIARGFPHFALGFCNGVYGDIAIPLVLAGASGALGPRIKHNIWWACRVINDAYHALDWESMYKLAAVFTINNKAMIAGKFLGSQYDSRLYKAAELPFSGLSGAVRFLANPIALVIIAFISHKRFICKLNRSDRLFVVLYVLLTGDNNLLPFRWSESNLHMLLSTLSREVTQVSVSELNAKYQQIQVLVRGSKKAIHAIRMMR